MPFTLFWEPTAPGQRVDNKTDENLPESLKKLVETFGPEPRRLMPVELARNHVMTLRAMGGDVFRTLADLIDVHGKIRVWGRD